MLVTTPSMSSDIHNVVPPEGYVPNQRVAIAIADAVLRPIYGDKDVDRQLPLTATLNGTKWTVVGNLQNRALGGVALAEIDRSSGAILRVSHGR
jgi:hypothetical protein